MVAAGALPVVSCSVGDYDEAETPDTPYGLVIAGSVFDAESLSPISGLDVLLYTYSISDTQFSKPSGSPEVACTDDGGRFMLSMEVSWTDVIYRLQAGGTDSSGKTWKQAMMEINVLSGSPSYDSSSNTYRITLSPLYLEAE